MADPAEADPVTREKNWCLVILKFMALYWRGIFLLVWPLCCCIVFLIDTDAKIRCMWVVLLMAGYWVTESIPLYMTGLLPAFLMPILGIQGTGATCKSYFNNTNMLFIAGLFIAISIEHSGLHLRIALICMMIIGCSPRRLHFGLSMVTMFLSMWLINTAATAMMCPIIHAVLKELEDQGIGEVYKPQPPESKEDDAPRPSKITIAFFLAAAYSSTIGGIGTLVGTGTNLTYKGVFETRFPTGDKIEFIVWFAINGVGMLLMNLCSWCSLQVQLMGLWRPKTAEYQVVKKGNENKDVILNVVKRKKTELGPMSWNEIGVAIVFVLVVLLWVFQKPQFMPGWADAYPSQIEGKDHDIASATPAIFAGFLLLAIPATCQFWKFCTRDKTKRPKTPEKGLVSWAVFQKKLPWGLVFLLGGGFAVADAGKFSGMSQYLGEKLKVLKALNSYVVLGLTSAIASLMTELTSNVAICNILLPVLMEMSVAMEVHPLTYTFPAAVCCSYAFLLPVGTPPNAIIVEEAHVKTIDMIKYGLVTKVITWFLTILLFRSYGMVFYDLGTFPDYANESATI